MSNSKLSDCSTLELMNELLEREAREYPLDERELLPDLDSRMTHAECVEAAAGYMQKRADVVLPEFYSWNAELPDVIAFNRDTSTVIECKVSRSDFLADKKKSFRMQPNSGMGDSRYYCCPKGLIRPEELPDRWGLLYVYPDGKVRKIRESWGNIKKNIDAEHHLLFYFARRAYYAGVFKSVLEYRGYD